MDAWDTVRANLKEGQHVTGKVVDRKRHGLFVDLGLGIPGFVDLINVKDGPIRGIEDLPDIGETVSARVVNLHDDTRQIRLSMKS